MTSTQRLASVFSFTLLLILLLASSGCSGGGTGPGKELEPLVGMWRAQDMVLTNAANPTISVDLVEEGATFTLSILSTGQYSAVLSMLGQSNTEVGKVKVSGNNITITPTSPSGPPLVATFEFVGEVLVLDGSSEFDFNMDGTPEEALAHIALFRLGS